MWIVDKLRWYHVPVNVYTPEEYNATDADFVFFEFPKCQFKLERK